MMLAKKQKKTTEQQQHRQPSLSSRHEFAFARYTIRFVEEYSPIFPLYSSHDIPMCLLSHTAICFVEY